MYNSYRGDLIISLWSPCDRDRCNNYDRQIIRGWRPSLSFLYSQISLSAKHCLSERTALKFSRDDKLLIMLSWSFLLFFKTSSTTSGKIFSWKKAVILFAKNVKKRKNLISSRGLEPHIFRFCAPTLYHRTTWKLRYFLHLKFTTKWKTIFFIRSPNRNGAMFLINLHSSIRGRITEQWPHLTNSTETFTQKEKDLREPLTYNCGIRKLNKC